MQAYLTRLLTSRYSKRMVCTVPRFSIKKGALCCYVRAPESLRKFVNSYILNATLRNHNFKDAVYARRVGDDSTEMKKEICTLHDRG